MPWKPEYLSMRVCQICTKGSIIQKSGAHQYGGGWAMRATKKRRVWMVNLHAVKVTYKGLRRTMRLCSKCLRRVKGEMKKVEVAKGEKSIPPKQVTPIAATA